MRLARRENRPATGIPAVGRFRLSRTLLCRTASAAAALVILPGTAVRAQATGTIQASVQVVDVNRSARPMAAAVRLAALSRFPWPRTAGRQLEGTTVVVDLRRDTHPAAPARRITITYW